jgi:hypothetical protein
VREHLGGLERAPHRLLAELAGGIEPLADPDREMDLVGALPPPLGGGEDDEPERVRSHVDDRGAVRRGHGFRAGAGRDGGHRTELRPGPGVVRQPERSINSIR